MIKKITTLDSTDRSLKVTKTYFLGILIKTKIVTQ